MDGDTTSVIIREYHIFKETEKCYWVTAFDYTDFKRYKKYFKLVPKITRASAIKQFAWETKELALKDLRRRLKKRISWYKYWLSECQNWLQAIEDNIDCIPDKPYRLYTNDYKEL